MVNEPKRLYRARSERMLGGVCGGIAHYVGMDPTVIRLLFVLLLFLSGGVPAILAYIILLFIIPEEPLPS